MVHEVLGVSHSHYRSVTVTSLSALGGVAAGLASSTYVADPTDTAGLAVLVAAVLVQYPLLYALQIDVEEFSKKDHLYVAFITFSMWFLVWGLLLTAQA